MSNELLKNINRAENSTLTLFNESGETYSAGEVTTLIRTNKGLTLRWKLTDPFNHALPLTHAIVHTGKRVWNAFAIKPLDNSALGTEIEVKIPNA